MPVNQHLARRPRRGMIVRSTEALEPGLLLFKLGHRFVKHQLQSDLAVVSTPWWFTAGTLELVGQAATRSGTPLADMMRSFGAVARRWGGSGDLVVRARLGAAVMASIGPGTIQDFRDDPQQAAANAWDMPLWVPSPGIPQVYVSLMDQGDLATSVAQDALDLVHLVPVAQWTEAFVNTAPPDKYKAW